MHRILDISSVKINSTSTLKEAIDIVKNSGERIALVVENQTLLGTISDGDIRRALLDHKDLNSSVISIMNSNPTTATEETKQELTQVVLSKYGVIPIIDENNRLKSAVSIFSSKEMENRVFIFAGGFGKRLYPLTRNKPKPMIEIGDKSIIERIIMNFKDQGFRRFVISTFYKGVLLKNHISNNISKGIEIEYVTESSPLGTAGALGLIKNKPKNDLIVINGDLLTALDFKDMLAFHEKKKSDITVGVKTINNTIPFGIIEQNNGKISNIIEKPSTNYLVNSGIYILSPNVLENFKPEPKDMTQFINEVVAKKGNVSAFPIHEYWIDIGEKKSLDKARIEFS